jgi:hypothetical protein
MDGLLSFLTPEQQAAAERQARQAMLTQLGFGLLQASTGAPGQRRPSLGQIVGQAGPGAMQAYQGGFDRTLQQIMLSQQMAEQQRKREMEEEQMRGRQRSLSSFRVASGVGGPEDVLAVTGQGPTPQAAAMLGAGAGMSQQQYAALMADPNLSKEDKDAVTKVFQAQRPRSQDLSPEAALYAQSRYGTANVSELTQPQAQDVLNFSTRPTIEQQIALQRLRFETGMGLPSEARPAEQKPVEQGVEPSIPAIPLKKASSPLGKNEVPLINSSALSPKQKQELELKKPETIGVVEFALDQTRQMANTARRLLANPNLERAFGPLGLVESQIPGTPAANILAELDVLRNQSFVQGLQAMRAASPTGGAVGNVSNAEGQRFENLQAALRQIQSGKQARSELERLVKELEGSEERLKNAFERTYGAGTQFQLRDVFKPSSSGTKGILRFNPVTRELE